MNKLKMFLKIGGLIITALMVVLLWFYVGSLIAGSMINAESNMLVFALILLLWWYLRVTRKVFDIIINQTEATK